MRRVHIPHENQKFNEIVPIKTTKYVFPHKYFSDEAREILNGTEYVYQHPADWTNVDSVRKSIAFRTARNSHKYAQTISFQFYYELYTFNTSDTSVSDATPMHGNVTISISEDNKLSEIVANMASQMNAILTAGITNNPLIVYYHIATEDDGSTSVIFTLKIGAIGTLVYCVQNVRLVPISDSEIPYSTNQFIAFLEYFNQESTTTTITNNANGTTTITTANKTSVPFTVDTHATLTFSNVWNREELYFHSDFAGISEHGLMARDGDFYQHPIKYPYTKSASLFKLWVSFDGKNPAKLLYPDFVVELDFVANADDNYND